MKPSLKQLQKIHVQQQDQSDCGVACLLSVIHYYSGSNTLENLRKLSGTSIVGTTLLGLYHAANQVGFSAEGCQADIESLIYHNAPCILHIITDRHLQHFVICFCTVKEQGQLKFIIGDPAKGITYLDRYELDQIWKSKTCLTLTPTESFKTVSDVKSAKQKWFTHLLKEDIPLLSIAAGLGIAIAIAGIIMATFSQRLIDDILPTKNFIKLNFGILLVFILLVIKELLLALRQFFLLRQSKEFNERIIGFFYNQLLRLPRPFFDTRKIGEFTARLNDTSRIQRVLSQLAGTIVIDVLVSVVSTVFVFTYSWKIGGACLIALPFFYTLIYLHNGRIQAGESDIMSTYALAEANYISTLQGIEPIKNHNKQDLFSKANKAIYHNYQSSIFYLGKVQVKLSFLANCFAVIFLVMVVLFSSYQVLDDHLKMGELIAILGICSSLLPSVANLAMISIPLQEAKIAFDRMFEVTSIKPEEDGQSGGLNHFNSLKADQLSFRYAGRSQLLKNISFELKCGEIVALMGENGSGKSTISQIIQKSYDPESGLIILNDTVPLEDISIGSWRNIIGIVPQQVHIFNGTVLENIAFDDAALRPEEVLNFLTETRFLSFIEMLPQSYMTLVGEEGINLSGGQKQMLALARALYHKPQLLILDEATAAMDRHSEQFVLNLLLGLKSEMGILFITHRLHVLKNLCDRIYILEGGLISVSGNHETLLQSKNLYSDYWEDLVFRPK